MNVHIPIGGVIRPGTKIPTKAAKADEQIMNAIREGRQAGKTWSQIEKEIHETRPDFKGRIFSPKNTPYFRVDQADFQDPQTALEIMRLYGEDDREGKNGVRRLYRIPVMFFAESDVALSSELKCYGASGKKFWAETENGVRYCKQYAQAEKPDGAKRVVRHYGGNPTILRADVDSTGRCVPEKCPEYQSRDCTEHWKILFYVAGIRTALPMKMSSRGFYGMRDVESVLQQIAQIRGTITGLQNGQPFFWFTKQLKKVKMIDEETGRPKQVEQWEIALDAKIDACTAFEERRLALPRGQYAAALLTGSVVPTMSEREGAPVHEAEDD
ncbi:MAG: recombination directionality factor [Acidiferrobacterales bacterium]